jgi:deoxyribodipyrimidine photo-lyase
MNPGAPLYSTSIVWLRRDLRLADHAALDYAARTSERVVCAFVLDPQLLRGPRVGAPIVQFFFDSLRVLRAHLRAERSDLALLEGEFAPVLARLARHVRAQAVFYNVDYDPEMRARDERVATALRAAKLAVHEFVDHVYAAAGEVVQPDGRPYTVYTPYRKRWQARFGARPRDPYASQTAVRGKLLAAAAIGPTRAVPRPEDFDHRSSAAFPIGGLEEGQRRLNAFIASGVEAYLDRRNIPAVAGTSHLSAHLRAGTIGIRACVAAALADQTQRAPKAAANVAGWIGELIWRDFYTGLLVQFPRIASEPFLAAGKALKYVHDEAAYAAWCKGATGYPIVDAAMIQLNTTGWMHNRLRMIVASFLTKHLLIDYHTGERYFEQHLADADLGANTGGWQWSASVGTDAAPYFRVFNPTLQGRTFDPDGTFVRSMIPALAKLPDKFVHEPWTVPPLVAASAGFLIGRDYPAPIVEHGFARRRALEVYGAALKRVLPAGGDRADPLN